MIIMMMKEKRSKKRTEYLRVFGLRVKGRERKDCNRWLRMKGIQRERWWETGGDAASNHRHHHHLLFFPSLVFSLVSVVSWFQNRFQFSFYFCPDVLFLFSFSSFSSFFLHLLFGSKNLFDTRAWNRWQWLQRHQSDIVLSSFLLTLSSTFSVSRLQWISLFRTLEPLLSFPFFLRTRKTLSIFELLEDISFLLLLIFSNRIESLYQPFLCHLYHCCCITVLSSRIPFFKSSRWSCWRWIIKKLERNLLKKERKTIDKTMRVTHKEGGNNKI